MTSLLSRRVLGFTGAVAALSTYLSLSGLPAAVIVTRPLSNMSIDLEKLGKNVIKKVPSMEEVPLSSLWENNSVVITMLRRFGWLFCRQVAKELSSITSLLESNGVKNCAIGLEEFGLEDFLKGEYFNGDLFLDTDKKIYKDVGYKRYTFMGSFLTIFQKKSRDAAAKNKQGENLPYDLKGDVYQNGGTLVVGKGGKLLLDWRQDNPADEVDIQEVLKVLNTPQNKEEASGSS